MRILLTLLITLLTLIPTAARAAESESTYDRVIRTGTIRCGYGISPPALVKDPNTGQLSGLDYDVWQAIGKELDLKVEFVEEAGWGNFIEGLKSNRYDVFCSMLWPDPGRQKFLSLTIPMIYEGLGTYVRTDDHRFDQNIEKINNANITVPAIEGDVSVSMVQTRFPKAKILSLPQTATVSEMMLSIISKKADAIFLPRSVFENFNKQNPNALREIKSQPKPFTFASYYGVRSGEIQLRDMINVALRTLIDDGRIKKIAAKYPGDYLTPLRNY